MTDFFADILEDAKAAPEVSDQAIGKISELAQKQIGLEEELVEVQEAVKNKTSELKAVQEQLAETMDEAGMASFKTKDGRSVEIKDFVSASIKVADKPEAFAWLEQNGHADLIKHEVKLTFKKGENDKAEKALQVLRDQGFIPDDKESVHSGTLSSFCREQIELGNPIPLDLLGVYQGRKSIIK